MNLKLIYKTLIASIVCGGFSIAAQAQDTQLTISTSQHDDWSVRCEQNKGAEKSCVMTQQALVQQSGQRLMQANIAKVEGEPKMTLVLPLGIFLPKGANLMIGEAGSAKSTPLEISFCNQSGCYANQDVNAGLLKSLKGGETMQVAMSLTNGKDVNVPLSTKGFSAAYKDM